MPTKILDIELKNLPSKIAGLKKYDRALILIRFNGRPIGKLSTSIRNGKLEGKELRDILMQASGLYLWERWLYDQLGIEETIYNKDLRHLATVAICTRDRTEDLKHCLDALIHLSNDGHEILVVDNCPSNNATHNLVENYRNIRYVREDRPGLSCARNRALIEAKHPIVAFTDDDAIPDPFWLSALLQNFNDTLVACTTGLTMPFELENEVQEWFERLSQFDKGFKRKVFEIANHDPLATGSIGAGVNMAFRRDILNRIGPFDEALGTGTPSKAGEDNEIFTRILNAGYRIVYEPTAICWHRHRHSWKALRNTIYGYGVGIYATWTRQLLFEKEIGVIKLAWAWFRYDQFPALWHALRNLKRNGLTELKLNLAELIGCIVGPWAYFLSRKRLKKGVKH